MVLLLAAAVVSPGMAARYSFTSTDNGKTTNVTMGDQVTVTLAENPTTGYRWVVNTSPGLFLLSDRYKSSRPGVAGAGGIHTWNYLVRGKGVLEFSAVYRQPWMPATGEDQIFGLIFLSGQKKIPLKFPLPWVLR
jgi:inhibitor of cysteine peptidase